MTKRFEFVPEDTIEIDDVKLTRIRALVDIPRHGVKVGTLGGYLEKEENLQGDAWVSGNAKVFGNAIVCGTALVFGCAKVFGGAIVCENALVFGAACVFGKTKVGGNAWIRGISISGNYIITGDSLLQDLISI